MTTGRLIALRSYNLTLGRIALFSRLLRKVLVFILITRRTDKYVASSGYFAMDELNSSSLEDR